MGIKSSKYFDILEAKKAFKENLSLKQAALKLKLIDEKKFNQLINPKKMI